MENIKTYLIYGIDKARKQRMLEEFKKYGLDNNKVEWISYPNKDDLNEELLQKYVSKNAQKKLRGGQIACTIKHYLILKDIVENKIPISLVLEDNIAFKCNYAEKIKEYLEQLNNEPEGWDILFDSSLLPYTESNVIKGKSVYKKTNEITHKCHGGTRGVACYLITLECAKKLYEAFLPIEEVSDFWYNHLFRKHKIRSFWVSPNNAYLAPHISTA